MWVFQGLWLPDWWRGGGQGGIYASEMCVMYVWCGRGQKYLPVYLMVGNLGNHPVLCRGIRLTVVPLLSRGEKVHIRKLC